MGEGEDFKLAESSTATTTANQDMALSYIEQSIHITYASTLVLPFIYSSFFKLGGT